MFDDPEMATTAATHTAWIEENLKKLQRERDDYRACWHTLKQWLSKRRDASSWTTIGMIEYYMEELENAPPSWQPPFVPENLIVGKESEME